MLASSSSVLEDAAGETAAALEEEGYVPEKSNPFFGHLFRPSAGGGGPAAGTGVAATAAAPTPALAAAPRSNANMTKAKLPVTPPTKVVPAKV